ncbi:hypothetical protein EXS57_03195 [Candidatus Kaiserbacteria bacterium]|nr:hypothetical protein [Candidatus Kaiserbacteria bacterium]
MHTLISVLFVACIVSAPSLVGAQNTDQTPPPPTVGTHPDVKPPTKPPAELLPATPFPEEVAVDVSGSNNESAPLSPTGSSLLPKIFTGLLALVVLGVVGYLWRHKRMGSL